jgi:hypothetical protein
MLHRYETWRSKRLSRPKVGTKVRNFAISTLVPVALAFYCAKNGVDMHTVSHKARWVLAEGWDCIAMACLYSNIVVVQFVNLAVLLQG